MPLLDRFSHPPKHFVYREPKTGMSFGEEGIGFYEVAEALFKHRSSNPRLFDETERNLEACELALDTYTCKRLKNSKRWCQQLEPPDPITNEPKAKKSSSEKGCASCGRRKKSA
jgi:hypothetical protein